MAHSGTWLTQDVFEREADRCLAEDDVTLDTITPYYVAQRLGRNANATVYRLFREWKARKTAEAGGPPVQLPAELVAPLAMMADRFKAELMAANIALLGNAMRTVEADANLKVATALRALAEVEAFAESMLKAWEDDTAALGEAQAKIGTLERELSNCRTELARLDGRLQQIMVDRARATEAGNEAAGADDDDR